MDKRLSGAYKQKTEAAKKDYLKQLAAYRARLLSNMSNRQTLTDQSYDELMHNGKSMSLLPQKSPDSTTLGTEPKVRNDIGEKSLASLIAEPTPLHILTATTTLTVPQTNITVLPYYCLYVTSHFGRLTCAE
ncbi:unnamed protein product [Soboliphyme baturini]|uniref:HMG box domain-containing protein n=1 Tax=Soboliphyme baturini TaxID=241478 RepID=A0A183IP27_9BILA|nr:unnamed protein product [Soboliphyme baturini]